MKIAIVTDAWHPQVNGVVRTLDMTIRLLQERGHDVGCITPDQFLTLPMPGYSQIRLAVAPRIGARRRLAEIAPDVVHIVTEGPIGWSARKWCIDHDVPFTTAFHTRFPDYAAVRTGLSAEYFWPVMRRFHNRSAAIFVSTERLRDELDSRAIYGGRIWFCGVSTPACSGPMARATPPWSIYRSRFCSPSGGLRQKRTWKRFCTSMCPAPR